MYTRLCFVSVFAFLSFGLALQNVTVARLGNGCAAYPDYHNTSSSAGPWIAIADSTATDLDGGSVNAEFFTDNGIDRFGFITLPKQPRQNAPSITMRCSNGTLQFTTLPLKNSSSSPNTWETLIIASDENWQSSIAFGSYFTTSIPVEPYAHYVNGTRLPGVFLGARNRTTWTFKYNWGGNAGVYYLLRLKEDGKANLGKRQLLPPSEEPDYEGYLKIA